MISNLNKKILEYYKKVDLKLPDDPTWRHFRIRNIDGKWIKIPKQISKPEQLRKYLVKYKALDVYYSISKFFS